MLYILLSILALSFVVFVHELGHFFFAKIFKVKVEVFSIGIGPSILKFKVKGVEYRFSPIIFGGYCKLKGSDHLAKELKENRFIDPEPGSLLSVAPFKRILIYFAGPLFNLIFSFLLFIIINMVGDFYFDYFPKVSVQKENSNFQSGDMILSIDGNKIEYFSDIYKFIPKETKKLHFMVLREKRNISFELSTNLADFLSGVSPWVDLIVSKVIPNSAADIAGIKQGDIIISLNNIKINNRQELIKVANNLKSKVTELEYKRNNKIFSSRLIFQDQNKLLGVDFVSNLKRVVKSDNLLFSIKDSFFEVFNFLKLSLYSVFSLITNLKGNVKSISGPIGIVNVLSKSFEIGIIHWIKIVSILSVIIAGMNLFFIIIPVFDGMQIVIILIEMFRGKRFSAKLIYRFYLFGIVLMFILFFISIFNDIEKLL